MPDKDAIQDFVDSVVVEGLKRIFKKLVSKLAGEGVIHRKTQVIDATPIDAFKSDPDAE